MDAHGYAVLSNNKKIGGVLGRDFLLSEAGNAVSVPAQRLDAAFWAIFLFSLLSCLFIIIIYLFFFEKEGKMSDWKFQIILPRQAITSTPKR